MTRRPSLAVAQQVQAPATARQHVREHKSTDWCKKQAPTTSASGRRRLPIQPSFSPTRRTMSGFEPGLGPRKSSARGSSPAGVGWPPDREERAPAAIAGSRRAIPHREPDRRVCDHAVISAGGVKPRRTSVSCMVLTAERRVANDGLSRAGYVDGPTWFKGAVRGRLRNVTSQSSAHSVGVSRRTLAPGLCYSAS